MKKRLDFRRPPGGDALVEAVSSLYEKAMSRMLTSSERVTSAAEGSALLAGDESSEDFADDVQRLAVLAIPVLRVLAKGARLTRLPWALLISTALSVGLTVRTGVRELQVLGSLVAHRLEQATERPADPRLVKKLAVELYLHPRRTPNLSRRGLGLHRLVRSWVLRGALGRSTGKAARKALEAAERLDLAGLPELDPGEA
jgi:hypothetical protein